MSRSLRMGLRYRQGSASPPRRRLVTYQSQPVPAAAPLTTHLHIVPAPQALAPATVTEVISSLSALQIPLAFWISSTLVRTEAGMSCESEQMTVVERVLRGVASQWEVLPCGLLHHSPKAWRMEAELMNSSRQDWAPLRDLGSFGSGDSLSSVLEAAQPLGQDETLLITFALKAVDRQRLEQTASQLFEPLPADDAYSALMSLLGQAPQVPRFAPKLHQQLTERLNSPCLQVAGLVSLQGRQLMSLNERCRSLDHAFSTQFNAGFGGIGLGNWRVRSGPVDDLLFWRENTPSLLVSLTELASLWHPPSSELPIPGVAQLRRRPVILPHHLLAQGGLLLGHHYQRGLELPVHLPRADLDAGHLACIGRTGVGKSTFIHQLLRQLIDAADRPGLCVIDPHGDLVISVAYRSVPPTRIDDVALLELGDVNYPVGLPMFRVPAGVPREFVVQTMFSVLRLIFREHWSPTRMEDAVFALTATLCNVPDSTVLDVSRLFGDVLFRRRALAGVQDLAVLEFWSDYEELSESARRELVRPILYRLRGLYRSAAVRNILCQSQGLDLSDLLDRGRLLLVNLAGQAIQAEADLLGELVIARLHMAALARLAKPADQRRAFYLAIDESQRFSGASPILLSEGRKLGISLLLSTQFLEAWSEALAQSVLGNVGTLVAFRCGPSDSRRLASSLRPFTPEQLEDLDRYEAIVKLQHGGETLPAFDFRSLPIDGSPDEARLARIRARTRQRYARPRREVEAELAAANTAGGVASREVFDVDEE